MALARTTNKGARIMKDIAVDLFLAGVAMPAAALTVVMAVGYALYFSRVML